MRVVLIERNGLHEYVRTYPEPLINEAESEAILEPGKDMESTKERRNGNLKNKRRHSMFEDTPSRELQCDGLSKATEGALVAAQAQTIRTRTIKRHIHRENISPLCRLCGERETISHLISP